ncbi:MAG: XkdQ/YqbQ family protein, partial [Clostridium sp.]
MDMIQHTQSQKPTLNLYKANGSKYNITELVDGIQWSGDYQQVSRKLDVDILYPVNDKNQSLVIPDIGDMMTLFVGEHELFRGVVWNRDLVENSQFMKLTCYDALINVTKSTTSYNLKNVSPESTV